jgi:hypothetical protein
MFLFIVWNLNERTGQVLRRHLGLRFAAEGMAGLGWDWLVIDMQHGLIDYSDMVPTRAPAGSGARRVFFDALGDLFSHVAATSDPLGTHV